MQCLCAGVVVALSLWAPLFASTYAILLPTMHVWALTLRLVTLCEAQYIWCTIVIMNTLTRCCCEGCFMKNMIEVV